MQTKFEWDDKKRQANIKKHGFDFVDAEELFNGNTITTRDNRFNYNEQRLITLGMIKGRVAVTVHTERNNKIRIISLRKASGYEKKIYYSKISD